MAFAGLFTMPIGLLFIGLAILFFSVGKTHKKVAKLKQYNETDLPPLEEPYIDDSGDVWEVEYKYDYIDIKLINKKFDEFKVNQTVSFVYSNSGCNIDNPSSVRVMVEGIHVGNINALGQRRMLLNYLQKEGYMVQAQFSFLSKENVFLRIIYYRSKKHREQEEAEARARYEAEKAAYIRKPPVSFDVTLVYNKNAEMQDDIQCVEVGEIISFEQEDDDRYLAVAKEVLYLGYLPKKIANKIDEFLNEGYEVVDSMREEKIAEDIAEEVNLHRQVRSANFTFSFWQIPVGAVLEHCEKSDIKCTVVDDRRIEYNGEIMYMTPFAKLISGKQYITNGPGYVAQHFKYNGELLKDIEDRIENEE